MRAASLSPQGTLWPDHSTPPPLFPFSGRVQCVAIYKAALPPPTILEHFVTGRGKG